MAVQGGRVGRYAAALFSIAKDKGTIDAWDTELHRLAAAGSDPQAMRVLTSPRLTLRQKHEVLEKVAGPLAREVGTLLTLLLERNRIGQIEALAESFTSLARKSKGIELADVTTAVPLADADRQAVGRWLATYLGSPVEIRYHEDPDIIGGVVARVGDQLIDASVRGRLDSLRKVLRET